MESKTKIRRKCKCGCGGITNYGKKWVVGHHSHKHTQKSKRKMSLSAMGNTNGKGNKGLKRSEETRLKMSLSMTKSHPNDQYCEAWRDGEYKKDLLKDYCEGMDCREDYKLLANHHINLNKHDCRPPNIMTLCASCHTTLQNRLDSIASKRGANHKDYLTIIRPDHITYVLKGTGETLVLKRKIK